MSNPFEDVASKILRPVRVLDSVKADAWDAYANASDHNELAEKIAPLALPSETKAALFAAKKSEFENQSPLEKTIHAIKQLGALPPETLDTAEQHPKLLRAVDAAVKGSPHPETLKTIIDAQE